MPSGEEVALLQGEVDDFFGFEEGFGVEVGYVPDFHLVAEGEEFAREVAAFEVEDAVAEGVVVAAGDFGFDPGDEFRQGGDGAGDNEVEFAVELLGADLEGIGVVEAEA